MSESYFVVEGLSDDVGSLCQVFFVKSKLSRNLLVRLLSFASPVKELRVLCSVQVTEEGPAEPQARPARYFVRLSRLLDPGVFLDGSSGPLLCTLLDREDAEELAQDWKDDPAYSAGAVERAELGVRYYYKNRVDAFASKVDDRWPIKAGKKKERG